MTKRFMLLVLALVVVIFLSHESNSGALADAALGDFLSLFLSFAFWVIFMFAITRPSINGIRCRILRRKEKQDEVH